MARGIWRLYIYSAGFSKWSENIPFPMYVWSRGAENAVFGIAFKFIRHWGLLLHIWHMRNAFIFDEQSGVHRYVLRLKGVLLWQLSLLERSSIFDHEERQACKLVGHHIRHLV